VLTDRWSYLLRADDRAECFKESSDRTIKGKFSPLFGGSASSLPIEDLCESAPCPEVRPYAFRSFDRQFIIADTRLLSRQRESLWRCYSGQQIYFASLLYSPLGNGPALAVSSSIPDLHYFSGRGAKDILPLYRDASPDFSPVVWKKAVPRGIICSGTTGYADRRGRPYEHRV
jgi:type ISP restriction-modification system protein